jgi:hypothetical protein
MDAYITTSGTFCDGSPSAIVTLLDPKSLKTAEVDENKEIADIEKTFKIYPNPNDGKFSVELKNFNSPVQIQVVNMLGATIYQSDLLDSENYAIGLSGLQNGIYFVKIKDIKSQVTRKFVVQ